jgi:biotin carboxylase
MRLLLLTTTTGYQTREFARAAEKIGLEVVFGSDRCHKLDDPWQDGALPLKFERPDDAARKIVDFARSKPLDAVVAIGDATPPAAARACCELNLPSHSPQAADVCRDKYRSREQLRSAGLNVPEFSRLALDADPRVILARAEPPIGFPCVLKPVALSASRGVIRADDPEHFISAFERIRTLLASAEVRVMRQATSDFIQVESYVEGIEVAVEALVDRGALRVLAVFDKPDPLVGPYFEETIYVTPSRLNAQSQARLVQTVEVAAGALGLHHGPLHAELRVNAEGLWVMEVAARSIGGLCSRALRFHSPASSDPVSLEELIVRLALGEDVSAIVREPAATGVMMIPVPEAGILMSVEGVDQARSVPCVEEIVITAKPNEKLIPLPEGSSYPGFIFARAESPQLVERALRNAHARLRFVVTPALPVVAID